MPDPLGKFTPLTDEQIKQATIGGEPTLHNDRIALVEYDAEWPQQFERERTRIRAALGERALQIEHVGSTSVPGLIAKPIIDIALVVANSAEEPAYVPHLESAGYVLHIREPEWHEHRSFKGPEINVNIHVFSEASEEVARMVLFRDQLRANSQDRELYAQTKRRLAERRWKYVQNYADAKSQVVQTVLDRAGYRSSTSA